MKIDYNIYQQNLYTKPSVTSTNVVPDFFIPETDSITQNSNHSNAIWSELKDQYDIRNATFEELSDISSRLYQSGEISLLDHAIMTFDPSKSQQAVNPNINETISTPDGRRDWITEFQSRAYRDLKNNNLQGYTQDKHISDILSRLDRVSYCS